jgi:predicted nucleic acid-binding protein
MLIDSDVLIAHLRGDERARRFLRLTRSRRHLFASAVSVTEVTGHALGRTGYRVATPLVAQRASPPDVPQAHPAAF